MGLKVLNSVGREEGMGGGWGGMGGEFWSGGGRREVRIFVRERMGGLKWTFLWQMGRFCPLGCI